MSKLLGLVSDMVIDAVFSYHLLAQRARISEIGFLSGSGDYDSLKQVAQRHHFLVMALQPSKKDLDYFIFCQGKALDHVCWRLLQLPPSA